MKKDKLFSGSRSPTDIARRTSGPRGRRSKAGSERGPRRDTGPRSRRPATPPGRPARPGPAGAPLALSRAGWGAGLPVTPQRVFHLENPKLAGLPLLMSQATGGFRAFARQGTSCLSCCFAGALLTPCDVPDTERARLATTQTRHRTCHGAAQGAAGKGPWAGAQEAPGGEAPGITLRRGGEV